MGCLMNLKCGKRQSLGREKDQTWGKMYGCRMMTQIKTEKTIMVDYTVISVHQWLPTSPEDGLTGVKRAFNRHKGWSAHMQCMLGTNSHERESQLLSGTDKKLPQAGLLLCECLSMYIY